MNESKDRIVFTPSSEPKQGGGLSSPEKDTFQESFLVKEEDELKELEDEAKKRKDAGESNTFHRSVIMFHHRAVKGEHTINLRTLQDTADKLYDIGVVEDVEEGVVTQYIGRLSGEIERRMVDGETIDTAQGVSKTKETSKDGFGREKLPDGAPSYSKDIAPQLRDLFRNPDARKEKELKKQMGVLVGVADGIGVFEGFRADVNKIQENLPYLEAMDEILKLDAGEYEERARKTLNGWDERFSGLLSADKTAVYANMGLAWEKVYGRGSEDHALEYKRATDLYGWKYAPQNQLQEMVRAQVVVEQGKTDLQHYLEQSAEHQEQMLEQFLLGYQQQMDRFQQVFGGLEPEKERSNWVNLEYNQELWQRFDPKSWPNFYNQAETQERELWDARWMLARAAFYKKVTAGFPDKYIENQDLNLLGGEQLEILYNMPGVKGMLEGYAKAIVNNETVRVRRGNVNVDMSFWDIKSARDFESFRDGLRNKQLLRGGRGMTEMQAREADAVAWNMMWIFNEVESRNSRYTDRPNAKATGLPGILMSADFFGSYHQQERFEGKMLNRQNWGAFSSWGMGQMNRIDSELATRSRGRRKINREKDEVEFRPAPKGKNWSWKVEAPDDPDEKERKVVIYAPECYPVKTAGSFFEHTTAKNQRGQKRSLSQLMSEGQRIDWRDVQEDSVNAWLYSKHNRAVKIEEYYNPGKPFETRDDGWAKDWAKSLTEIYFTRLQMGRTLENLRRAGVVTHQTIEKLKALPVYAATGGVADESKTEFTLNMSYTDKIILRRALSDRNVRYLEGKEGIEIK